MCKSQLGSLGNRAGKEEEVSGWGCRKGGTCPAPPPPPRRGASAAHALWPERRPARKMLCNCESEPTAAAASRAPGSFIHLLADSLADAPEINQVVTHGDALKGNRAKRREMQEKHCVNAAGGGLGRAARQETSGPGRMPEPEEERTRKIILTLNFLVTTLKGGKKSLDNIFHGTQ